MSPSMSFEVYLTHEEKWLTSGTTWVRGNGFIDGEFYSTESLLAEFESIESFEEFETTVENTNGFFAIIHELDDRTVLAVDQIRSIPLYYGHSEDGFVVGSDSHLIAKRAESADIRPLNESEYILTGYVAGPDTLCEDVSQMQAGEIVSLPNDEPGSINRHRYYQYRHSNTHERSVEALLDELDTVTKAAFSRLIEYADGRPIVINMSGGYDSRLLASMLTRLGYDNLIAFTYEYSGDEKEYCKEIAKTLNIEWEYVTQTHQEWREWYRTSERKELDRNAGLLGAMPTIGPAIAMKKLHEQNRVPEDSIFVTGDSASTTGDHIPSDVMKASEGTRDLAVESIISAHYEFWDMDSDLESRFRDRVSEIVDAEACDSREAVADAFELWDWQERQAKHILRTYLYDHWDYDFWYPLWDREFMDFWRTVPLEHRFERSLFERYVRSVYADAADLSMDAVRDSFHERSPWVSRIETALSGTPLKDPAEQFYRHYISPREYDDNPIWGIMEREQFDRLHSGRQVIHAFRVLELLGRLSFAPPIDGEIAQRGTVTVSQFDDGRLTEPLIATDNSSRHAE